MVGEPEADAQGGDAIAAYLVNGNLSGVWDANILTVARSAA